MTDVGKIKLGVEIDADALAAKLGEAVRTAIAPALAAIQRELNKVQREYDETARAAEASAVRQVAANQKVASSIRSIQYAQQGHTSAMGQATAAVREAAAAAAQHERTTTRQKTSSDSLAASTRKVKTAQDELNTAVEIFGRKSPQAEAAQRRLSRAHEAHTAGLLSAATASRASTDSQVNDYHRLARAAEESAARQAAADRAAGTGRRGPPGNNNRRGGVLGFLTGPVGLNSIALGAQALPAALTGVTNLVGAVQQLGQAGLALPAIYGAAGASIGVAVLGFKGMGEAVKALNEAAKSGDMTKANEALKDMAPEAQNVAKALSQLMQGPWKDLRKGVQSHMFAGFDQELRATSDKAIPRLTGNINKIGDAWNGTLKTLTGSLRDEKNLSLFDRFLGNTAEGQKRANKAIDPLVHSLSTLMSTGGEFLPRLGDGLAKVVDRFDTFISKAGNSGQLWKWIDEGLNGMRALGNAVLNIGKTLTGLTKAAGGDGGFLGWLERATSRMQLFVNSADGQSKLREFFTKGHEDLRRWGDLLSTLAPVLLQIVKGFAQWGEVTLPIVKALADIVGWLNQIPGLVSAAVTAFLAFRTVSAIVGGIGGKLGMGSAAGGAAGGGILGGGKFGKGLMGLAIGAGGNMIQQQSQESNNVVGQVGGALGTIGGLALTGGMIGGPIGAGVGAGLGAAIASITYLMGEDAKAAKIAADAHAVLTEQMKRGEAAALAMRDAQMALNNDLLRSQGKIDAGAVDAVGERIRNIPDSLSSIDPKEVERVSAAIKNLGLDQQNLATIVANGGPALDAVLHNLQAQGPAGVIAAQSIQQIAAATQQAANVGAQAGPILQRVADALTGGDTSQLAANLRQMVNALPSGQAITEGMAGVTGPGGLIDILHQLNVATSTGEGGVVRLTNGIDPAVLNTLQQITGKLLEINNQGEIRIQTNTAQGQLNMLDQQLGTFWSKYQNMLISPQIVTPTIPGAPGLPVMPPGWKPGMPLPSPGGASGGIMLRGYPTGGVLPGYSPGVDDMMVPLSGGEGIIIPEAMRALGGGWLYGLNSQFRPGISRAGYSGGGTFGFAPGGVNPDGMPNDTTTIGLLTQIRDLLAGRGSGANGPLSNMANNTQQMASGLAPGSMMGGGGGMAGGIGGTTGWEMGPFGTPIAPRNHGWEMMAAAIQALGGQPELFIGPHPATYAMQGGGGYGMPGMAGMPGMGGGADVGKYAAALAAFARSGSISDVTGVGLDANDSVISAIVSARNKKKNGLTDDAIAGLVQQIVGGGGFTGTMTDQNSALVRALTTFNEKLSKGGMGMPGAMMPGMAASSFGGGGLVPFDGSGAGSAAALINFAQRSAGGKYAAASDLAGGLADCSGAVSDLVEFLTQGKTSPARLFSTSNEASVLQSLGATHGLVPGGLQIGISPAHTAATLPNGVNFESGGSGGGVVYGGKVGAADAQFTDHWTLPVSGAVPAGFGMPGAAGMPASMGGGGFGGGGGIQQVFVVNMPGGGMGGALGDAQALQAAGMAAGPAAAGVGAAAGAGGQALTNAVKGINVSSLTGTRMATPTAENTKLATLLHERNPAALFRMAGFNVPDFTRTGGDTEVQAPGQQYDATGRLFSSTGALMQRTFTDLNAQFNAMRSQTVGVMEGVKTRLEDKALTPIMSQGVSAGFSSISPGTFNTMGGGLGVGAAPPIAAAVGDAVSNLPIQQSSPGLDPMAGIGTVFGLAAGGPVYGGTAGKDSVPALLMPNEFVLNTLDVARMGGPAGVERFRSALANGSLRRFAAGGSAGAKRIGNDDVGADFFGVSEIPIIGTIINLLIRVLLKVIGVDIEVRDTLSKMTDDFRGFRGDAFKAFDAQGRLLNDTSALIDRSSTSAETAADERIRILKLVIEALIKYIIEKVIVPVTKAIANAALQGVASAAGMAINSQAPGAGSVASALITSLGQAGIEIGAEVGTDFALALSSTLIDVIAEGLVTILPDLMQTIFNGGLLASLFNPLGMMLTTLLGGFMGTLTALFGGLFGGAATLIPGLPFDSGGMAKGMGLLPKATSADELMLSPTETDIFTRFVAALERGGFGGNGNRSVHAPITVIGGSPETPQQIQDRLVKFMP